MTDEHDDSNATTEATANDSHSNEQTLVEEPECVETSVGKRSRSLRIKLTSTAGQQAPQQSQKSATELQEQFR